MSSINTTNVTHRDWLMHTVETADSPAGPWTVQPHVYCDRLSLVAGGVDQATLSYHFGRMIQPGQVRTGLYEPLDLRRKFVRITVDQDSSNDLVWIGIILAEEQSRYGALLEEQSGNVVRRLAGDVQVWSAAGVEWLLDRTQITGSVVATPASSTKRIERTIAFNSGSGQKGRQSGLYDRANRSSNPFISGHAFSDKLDNAELWTGQQILEHVLEHHVPGTLPITFELSPSSASMLSWFTPQLDPDGKTPLAILSELANPRRGLSWRVVPTSLITPTLFWIIVFSYTDTPVTLPSGANLPANGATRTLDFDRAIDIDVAALRWVEDRKYNRVRCRGHRRGAVFTASHEDGTLEADWGTNLETDYRVAPHGGTSTEDKVKNDEFRRSEKFARVFRCFRIPPTWDGLAGDGSGSGTKSPAFPAIDAAGQFSSSTAEPFWHAGLRLLNLLPCLTDHDYTGSQPADNSPAGSIAEPRPAFVLMQVDADGDKYQYAEKLSAKGPDGEDGKFSASFYLRMQENSFGIELTPSSGLPHLLADNDESWPSSHGASEVEPEIDWHKMRATVFCEHDSHVEAEYPTGLPAEVNEELVIDIGERARLDWLVPRTVVDHEEGAPVLASSAGVILRDDRPLLKDVARMAFLWYERPRAAFTLAYRQLRVFFALGDFITSIGFEGTAQTVGTVVTSIELDFERGATHVRTDFAELDFTQFLPL